MSFPYDEQSSDIQPSIYKIEDARQISGIAVKNRLKINLKEQIHDGYSGSFEVYLNNYSDALRNVIIEFLDECKALGYTIIDPKKKGGPYVVEW